MDTERKIVSVKEAVTLFGERFEVNSASIKPQIDILQNPQPRTRELYLAMRDMGRFNDDIVAAESVKSQAEFELLNAKKTAKNLSSRIEESNSEAMAQIKELEKLKKPKWGRVELPLANGNSENYEYAEVMRELEHVKQELSKLKLDMSSDLERKRQAEMETRALSSKMQSNSSLVEAISNEIEDANEEQLLVELARIEALREFGAIEAQRKEEANRHSSRMDLTKKKMSDLIQDLHDAKELEMELDATNSDVDMLQSQLELVKEMDRRVQRNEASFRAADEPDSQSLLQSVTEELEAAKTELASIKAEGFQFMASMDIVRIELQEIMKETARLRKTEDKVDSTVQNLNWKLLRARSKLESATAAEEKAKSIVSNMSISLEQLNLEAEAAKEEKELISSEAANIEAEVEKTESEIDSAEDRLDAALEELEVVKSSETTALEKLKSLIDSTERDRALASQRKSTITISNFEYEYLRGRAVGAEEVADKKVAAARAWIEALKAGEKEIEMHTEIASREIRELKVEEERENCTTDRQLSARILVERGFTEELAAYGTEEQVPAMKAVGEKPEAKKPRKFGNSTPARRGKFRKSAASPGGQQQYRVSSYTVKKRRKAMPSLAKFFNGKKPDYCEL